MNKKVAYFNGVWCTLVVSLITISLLIIGRRKFGTNANAKNLSKTKLSECSLDAEEDDFV